MSGSNRRERVASVCAECGAPVTFELGAPQVICGHCDAGLVVERGARLVRLGCPRCGGNFLYIDGGLCGNCPYCEAPLLALTRDRVLRYVVRPTAERPAEAEGAQLMLLPFWHLGGLVYAWDVGARVKMEQDPTMPAESGDPGADAVPHTVRRDSGPRKAWAGRVVDLTQPDPATLALGVTSLRLRGAVFPLEPFAREHEGLGRIVPPSLARDAAQEQLLSQALTAGVVAERLNRVDCRRSDLVAESLALYYYPFWIRSEADGGRQVWDAVTGQVEPLGTVAAELPPPARSIFDELQLVELHCSACGEDLVPGNRASVLPCRRCGAFYRVGRSGLEPFQARFARPRQQAEGELAWLPFWRVAATVRYAGRTASRAPEARAVLGLLAPPGDDPRAGPEDALCYFVPAYGALRAPRIDHAARDLTRRQPLLESGDRGQGELYNCFLDESDARDLAYVTWILVLPGTVPHKLRSLRIERGAVELWYLPFAKEPGGRELVELLAGVRYDRNTFRGMRH